MLKARMERSNRLRPIFAWLQLVVMLLQKDFSSKKLVLEQMKEDKWKLMTIGRLKLKEFMQSEMQLKGKCLLIKQKRKALLQLSKSLTEVDM